MNRLALQRFAAGCLILPLFGAGCGPDNPRPKVEGTVTYQGKAVGSQTLTLHMKADKQEDSYFHRVPIQPDGSFKGDAPAPGAYHVVIELPISALEGKAPTDMVQIPQKYRAVSTTTLTWTIGPGENKKEFALTD